MKRHLENALAGVRMWFRCHTGHHVRVGVVRSLEDPTRLDDTCLCCDKTWPAP